MVHPTVTTPRATGARIGAFFDVDNTLIPGVAIEVRFFHFLWQRGLVGATEGVQSLWVLLRHMPPVSLQALRERKVYLSGKRWAAIEALAEPFFEREVRPRLSQDGLAVLQTHRERGHELVLVTGSLDFLITPLAAHLGVPSVLAAQPERVGDVYSGRLRTPVPYGDGKRRLLEAFARERGLDLAASYAYGDSPGDVAALRSVGHPRVVNPIRGMARIARRQGWPVARWV